MKRRVAFVVQRCGAEVNGGAEAHCLQVAQHMSRHWQTEVLTTCALDYMTWENAYPPGSEEIGGTIIRRFPVDTSRDVPRFNRLSEELRERQASASLAQQEEWMRAQGPMSAGLLDYLVQHRDEYDAFIFFGYLYATTYFGLPLVAERAFLAPLAHDEWTLCFSMWDEFFKRTPRFIFNTSFEQDFLRRRFPLLNLPGPVVGVGIDAPSAPDAERFRSRYRLESAFLLYVGRIDESKGCGWLLDHFRHARAASTIDTKLILIGSEVMPIPFHDDVIHLGFVDETEKWDALAACEWLVIPSPHESLSMVLLEAWAVGRPAIVTAGAEVLIGQCKRAHGGLWYRNWEELEAILRAIDEPTRALLGRQGQKYVASAYSWDRVERDYLNLLPASSSNDKGLSPTLA